MRMGRIPNVCVWLDASVEKSQGTQSQRAKAALSWGMIHHFHPAVTRDPARMRWFLGAAWLLILAKCALVWWAVAHWQVPFHPAWIVIPTLLFAALATALWLAPHAE